MTQVLFKNGQYDGSVKNENEPVPNGSGQITYKTPKSVITYNGEWSNGLSHGKGVSKTSQGTYDGQWMRNHMHGEATCTFQNGDVYSGQWRLSKMHGQGKYTWSDSGDLYEGDFCCGKRHGYGVYTQKKSMTRYEGYWLNDERHGPGREVYSSQNKFEGTWKNGKRCGTCYYFIHRDNIRDEKKQNYLQSIQQNYAVYEREYENGTKISEKEIVLSLDYDHVPSIDMNANSLIRVEKDFTSMNMNNVFLRHVIYGLDGNSLGSGLPCGLSSIERVLMKKNKLAELKLMRERRNKMKGKLEELNQMRSTILEKALKLEDIKRDGSKQDMATALRDLCNTEPPGDGMMEDIFRMKLSVQIQKLNEQMAALDKSIEEEQEKDGNEKDGPESSTEWKDNYEKELKDLEDFVTNENKSVEEKQITEDAVVVVWEMSDAFNELVNVICDFLNFAVCHARSQFTPSEAKGRDLLADMNQKIQEVQQLSKTQTFTHVYPDIIQQRMKSYMDASQIQLSEL